jgi:hypothetical protein
MRFFPGVHLLLGAVLALSLACSGEEDAGPPPKKTLTPKGSGGSNTGGSNTGGSNTGGSAGQGGDGGSSVGGSSVGGSAGQGGVGGSSGAGTGGSSAGGEGGSSAGGDSGSGGSSAGGSSAGGSSAGGSSAGGASGEAGSGGVAEGKCTAKVDCDEYPDRPLCNLELNLCVACLSDGDCTKNPDEKVCDVEVGRCVECLKQEDCSGHPNGPHCDLNSSQCTCKSNGECTESSKGKLCDVEGLRRCGECITAFDCKNPQKPGCSLDNVCFKGDFCVGDDPEEAVDDGPLGATDVTPPVLDFPEFPPWKLTLENRHICDLPVEESDWYRFKAEDRDAYELSVNWGDPEVDLDLIVMDSTGRLYGYNYYTRPAKVLLTYLPAGTYYAFVYRAGTFDKLSTKTTSYSLSVTRFPEAGKCVSSADCAETFSFQFYRGNCNFFSGVCTFIEGNNKLGKGAHCDDDKDCESGRCSYQPFTRNAHKRSFCTTLCGGEGEECPSGQRCATYVIPEICVAACSVDDECSASISSKPPAGKNWDYLTCNKDSGGCE